MTNIDDKYSAEQLATFQADVGHGVSFAAADQARSIINIFQSNSPETNPRDVKYLEGAEPGDWHLRNAVNPIVPGTKGFEGVVLGRRHGYAEFLDGRGGFAGWHDHLPDGAALIPNTRRQQYRQPGSSNVLEESHEIWLWINEMPFLFPCASTKIAFARRLNSDLLQRRFPGTDQVLPCCAHRYLFTTKRDSNTLGSWFSPTFEYCGLLSNPEYKKVRPFALIIERGRPGVGANGNPPAQLPAA